MVVVDPHECAVRVHIHDHLRRKTHTVARSSTQKQSAAASGSAGDGRWTHIHTAEYPVSTRRHSKTSTQTKAQIDAGGLAGCGFQFKHFGFRPIRVNRTNRSGPARQLAADSMDGSMAPCRFAAGVHPLNCVRCGPTLSSVQPEG